MTETERRPKDVTLHMIGNAHLDPVWLWRWQEGFQEAKATFRSVLSLMREYPDFVFTSSSAAIYEWVERSDPGMFREIRQRVSEGRWRIVGGWWIQPDCNVPGGESFVRQGLYGQRYFREKLGVVSTVGYNVDSFGHNGNLPQILRKSSMRSYVFMRPGPHEKELPGPVFWWESADGSRVLAFRIPDGYATWQPDLAEHVCRCAEVLRPSLAEGMCFYGVGNHGGGPTRENLESIRALNESPDYPTLVMSDPESFFESVSRQGLSLPVVRDDLQHHASGCYSAESGVKRLNRTAENRLVAAEKLSAVAELVTGQPYPDDLELAWKDVLFNQFHDILAGTSIRPAYEDARNLYGEALAIADRGLNYAAQSISWSIGIEQAEGTRPVVVFNPHPWPSRANVELEFGRIEEGDVLVDDEGDEVPFQRVTSRASVEGWRNRISFTADLPPLGYRTYRMTRGAAEVGGEPEPPHAVGASDTTLESDAFRLEVDTASGCIARLLDKRHGVEVFGDKAALGVVLRDESDTWSHGVFRYDNVEGEFRGTRARLLEHGPVKSVLRVESEYGSSALRQDFTVYPDLERIDVAVTVDWRERFRMLKLRFPVSVSDPVATCEIPYGFIERDTNGEEEPGQAWVDVTGRVGEEQYGVSVLNDGKYSFDVSGSTLSLTVLRSPIYAHHEPYVPEEDRDYEFVDQGVQTFRYSIVPHGGTWREAGTVRLAAELNQRPVCMAESCHEGSLPQRDSYLSIEPGNVVLGALKKAEEGDDLIVRCYEAHGRATGATVRIPPLDRTFEVGFGPCEIKTLRVPRDPGRPVTETSAIEWEEGV